MKEETSTIESKSCSPFARISRTKEHMRPRFDSPNGVSPGAQPRPKPPPQEANNNPRTRRSILQNKPKMGTEESIGSPKGREMEDSKIAGRHGPRAIEQYVRLRRRADTNRKGSEDETGHEKKVKELRSEVSALKAQLEKTQGINAVLESQNKQFAQDLLAAEAKIKSLERCDQVEVISKEVQPSEFRDVRELIANKLDLFRVKRGVANEDKDTKMQYPEAKSAAIQPKVAPTALPPPSRPPPVAGLPPPPPPPPPPCRAPSKANTMRKASSLVEFYHSLTKRDGKNEALGNGNCTSPGTSNAHNSIVGELQNRSAHLLAIKADVEKKGDFINHLIQKVQSAAFTDMEQVLIFVDWLDRQLSTLADERAVLKHFNWPERKADALSEAAFEYRDLKRLQTEITSFEDDASMPCEAILKKITTLLDKSERSIQRLIKLRDTTVLLSYRDNKIPTEWMLDSGMVSKIKLASVRLAKVYMKRVSTELELIRHSDRESIQEALLFQGVRFAYRAYQFAGGLDAEAMHAFEELKEQVQLHRKGSRDSFHGAAPH